jgi:Holliday junction resolvase RusA-like endonuclease
VTRSLTFTVYGEPKAQGSKRAIVNRYTKKPVVIESGGEGLKDWRQDVKAEARKALATDGGAPLEGALKCRIVFWLRRPKSTKNTWPVTRPDLSKLARAVEDAMQDAGLFRDDSQLVIEHLSKHYTTEGPHASVTIEEIP